MSKTINEDDFIKEIQHCLGENDLVKSKALLQFYDQVTPKCQNRVLYEISKAQDKVAYPMLVYMGELHISNEGIISRLHDLILDKSYSNHEMLIHCIQSKQLKSRSLYIRIAGELQVPAAVPILREILVTDTDEFVLKETIKALSESASSQNIRAIADFIYYGNEELKQEAIFALAQIGGPTAIHHLAEAIRGNNHTDQLIIEALAEIQDQLALEKLCGMLSSHFVNIRNWAIDHLVEIGPKAVPVVVDNLTIDDEDTLVHTLNVLGNIGDKAALPSIIKMLNNKPDNPNIRFAAYEALERLPSTKSAISLAAGLEDTEEQVRLAAARAINNNMTPILAAGLKNMVSGDDSLAESVVGTIIDAEADSVFTSMIEHPEFASKAIDCISNKSHPNTKKHFIGILKQAGKADLASQIEESVKEVAAKGNLKIFVVDDSKMMLRLYLKKLHKMGHDPVPFEFPAEAIRAVEKDKPDMIITDLNMPQINGLQLTEAIRRKYDQKALPVLMITTQSDFVGSSSSKSERVDSDTLKKTGVNIIMNKPFDDKDLEANIKSLTS